MTGMLRSVQDGDLHYEAFVFWCPGCALDGYTGLHMLPVNSTVKAPSWSFDGNVDAPTLSPSILTNGDDPAKRCHSFIRNGMIEFLSDCGHGLAGQTVPLPDLPEWVADER